MGSIDLPLWQARIAEHRGRLAGARPLATFGRLTRVTGLVMEAVGLRLPLGANCLVSHAPGLSVEAEVVGFNADSVFLMPVTDPTGLTPGAIVTPIDHGHRFPVGEALLGRVVDASGKPLDGGAPLPVASVAALAPRPLNPIDRETIRRPLDVGIRSINALFTVGRGQRMGLFAGSGVGKSVLLGMMARYTAADVIVVGLIGERGREVKEFIEQILGGKGPNAGLARAVVVAAPADVSPVLRLRGAAYATAIAEHFRDRGKNVLLIMDSLTRYAMAQREIALAIGEPPATKGYPPSVFAKLPQLVERAGTGQGSGSITAFYTVLTEGDDPQDPIADAARAILDGHIVLSRTLADQGHYPAIDVEQSISRVMHSLVDPKQQERARQFRQLSSRLQRNRDLINVGAYVAGSDPVLDRAVALGARMEAFTQQDMDLKVGLAESQAALQGLIE